MTTVQQATAALKAQQAAAAAAAAAKVAAQKVADQKATQQLAAINAAINAMNSGQTLNSAQQALLPSPMLATYQAQAPARAAAAAKAQAAAQAQAQAAYARISTGAVQNPISADNYVAEPTSTATVPVTQ